MEFEGRRRIATHLNVAPLVDVVFLLLIFFLLTSTYIAPQALDLVLPSSRSATSRSQGPVTVVLDRAGVISVDDRKVAAGELQEAVARALAAAATDAVTFESDGGVSVQAMLDVLDSVRLGGGRELLLVTRPK